MNEAEKLKTENQKLQQEIEFSNNGTVFDQEAFEELRNNIESCQQESEKRANDIENLIQSNLNLKNETKQYQREAVKECNLPSDQLEQGSLQPTGNIVISLIRHVENAREIDACLGMSTDFGYITSNSCCQADQVTLFDLETYDEIPIEPNSTWVEENICFINITEIQVMNFPNFDSDETQNCSTLVFDEPTGEFTQYEIDIEIGKCFDSPCSVNSDLNGTILNGTSVVCDHSNQIGVITKSKLHFS